LGSSAYGLLTQPLVKINLNLRHSLMNYPNK
jgi:hypothetical protein